MKLEAVNIMYNASALSITDTERDSLIANLDDAGHMTVERRYDGSLVFNTIVDEHLTIPYYLIDRLVEFVARTNGFVDSGY